MQAFVELTRRFQHFAFGTALALVHDFQKAEDVVQDAFLAAWSAAEPRRSEGISWLAPGHRSPPSLSCAAAE
jgi:DNA-directed RNA polymerase specialized sigma24 family protein